MSSEDQTEYVCEADLSEVEREAGNRDGTLKMFRTDRSGRQWYRVKMVEPEIVPEAAGVYRCEL